MQDRVMVSSNKIQAIAAAINEKTGNNAGMTLEEMAEAIKNIPSGEGEGNMTGNFYIPIFGVKAGIVVGTIEYNS